MKEDIKLLDFFAAMAMQAKIQVWDSEISDKHRKDILEDLIERYGKLTVQKAMVKSCYDIAEEMLKEHKNRKNEVK